MIANIMIIYVIICRSKLKKMKQNLVYLYLLCIHLVLHSQSDIDTDSFRTIAYCEINSIRSSINLNPFGYSSKLSQAAQFHAESMAKNNFFNHVNSKNLKMKTLSMRIKSVGYEYTSVGENIAYYESSKKISGDSLSRIFYNMWKQSPPHWKNITSTEFKEVGIGIYVTEKLNKTIYYIVQNFGAK